MEQEKKLAQFYGGVLGPWIPMITMIVLMIISTATKTGGLNRVVLIAFTCLALGFFLCKDKKNYGNITLKGLVNPMLGTILMAYILAGVLAQLMRQSGIINALIWAVTKLGLNTGFLPLIAFVVCMLISTSCGTWPTA